MQNNSYLPLFRKYRPQSFDDVIGQEFTVRALKNAIQLNKIANAYLFCGPRGTGKTSSARIFAKSLNCMEGPTVSPCQKCQSCIDVTNASGLDVIEIDAATNRGIDDAKELIAQVQYAPMNGKYKIFIIDEVHMLSKEAFNALLKTFEEPPENVIFILATTEPHKVIETIVSRCQRFDFRRITIDDIVKRLREISDIEKINITDDALFTIAKNVSGGMRDSLALLDQASILGIEKQITKDIIESLIGKLTFDVLYNLTSDILDKNIEKAVSDVENIYEKGSEPRNFVENYIEFLRNVILAVNSKDNETVSSLTLFSNENIEKIKNDTRFKEDTLIFLLDKTIEFYKEIKISTNPYLWAELMVINLTAPNRVKQAIQPVIEPVLPKNIQPAPKIQTVPATEKPDVKNIEPEIQPVKEKLVEAAAVNTEIKKELSDTEAACLSETANEQELNEEKVKQVQVQDFGNPAETWSIILNKVESIPAKFFYSGVGKLVNIQNSHITLGFVNENVIGQAKSENKYNPLMKAIKSVLGDSGSIEFITVDANTKIIASHISIKTNPIPQSNSEIPSVPQIQNEEKQNSYSAPKTDRQNSDDKSFFSANKEEKEDLSAYTKTTREMLETFNGRVVE